MRVIARYRKTNATFVKKDALRARFICSPRRNDRKLIRRGILSCEASLSGLAWRSSLVIHDYFVTVDPSRASDLQLVPSLSSYHFLASPTGIYISLSVCGEILAHRRSLRQSHDIAVLPISRAPGGWRRLIVPEKFNFDDADGRPNSKDASVSRPKT